MVKLSDHTGRSFSTLRLSLTDRCNLACTYCVADDACQPASSSLSTLEYMDTVAAIHAITPLSVVRLTGGEPTLSPQLQEIVEGLNGIGIPQVKMTTNALLMDRLAAPLKKAGLHSINISLDAVDPETFFKISGRDKLQETLRSIEAIRQAEIPFKLNMVVMRGVNDHQILPMFEYARSLNAPIRFLELMQMGHLRFGYEESFFSEQDILWQIAEKYPFQKQQRKPAATANYWACEDGFEFGIISNTSSPFCHDCNRLRLDSKGYIYGCLSDPGGIYVGDCLKDKQLLIKRLEEALAQKKQVFSGSSITMKYIGG